MKVIENVKQEIINNEKIIGKMIDYEELQKLHKKYFFDLDEKTFATEVLEITYTHYRHMKNENKRGRIFSILGNEMLQEIICLLTNDGYNGMKITYNDLKNIKLLYANKFDEEFFATKCLKLPLHNGYYGLKNNPSAHRSIKLDEVKKQEKVVSINEILLKIKNLGIIGKNINYPQFQKLYFEYGEQLTETHFAQAILGISYPMYCKIKSDYTKRAKINDNRIKIVARFINENLINENRYYSNKELEDICNKTNISIGELIQYCILKNSVFYLKSEEYINKYMNVLNNKGKLYIGKAQLSQEFTNNNMEFFNSAAKRISRKYRYIKNYFNIDDQDYEQNILMYAFENFGELEKNFYDDLEFFKTSSYNQMNRYYWAIKMRELDINYKTKQIQNKRYNNTEFEFVDINENVQDKIEEIIQLEEINKNDYKKAILIIKDLNEQAMNKTDKSEAMQIVMKKYNINKHELLFYLKMYTEIEQYKLNSEEEWQI